MREFEDTGNAYRLAPIEHPLSKNRDFTHPISDELIRTLKAYTVAHTLNDNDSINQFFAQEAVESLYTDRIYSAPKGGSEIRFYSIEDVINSLDDMLFIYVKADYLNFSLTKMN